MAAPWTKMGKSSHLIIQCLYCLVRTDTSRFYRQEMESDDLRPVIPNKRSLSLTPDLDPTPTSTLGEGAPSLSHLVTHPRNSRGPVSKRSKFTYETILDSHEKETMGVANPLGRKLVKQKSKKERKAARRTARTRGEGMVVDNIGEAVEFTFLGT